MRSPSGSITPSATLAKRRGRVHHLARVKPASAERDSRADAGSAPRPRIDRPPRPDGADALAHAREAGSGA